MKTINTFRAILAGICLTGAAMISTAGCSSDRAQETNGEAINDAMISTHVQVDTFKGTVQLSGFVDTGDRKGNAEVAAKQVEGVKEVVNDITVK
jgi:osmotically-inducible protein OsmY